MKDQTFGKQVILIDDDDGFRSSICQTLELHGWDVSVFANASKALTYLNKRLDCVIVSDIRMPEMGGIEFLKAAHEIDPELPIVLVTGYGDIPEAVKAVQLGAYDYLEKPFASDHLVNTLRRARQLRNLTLEKRSIEMALEPNDPLGFVLIGRSRKMEQIRDQVTALAASDINTLISGETGTGKELIARTIHESASPNDRPFVAVNLTSLPEHHLEAELFGYETGAFPGANRAKYGQLEHARNGTLFLDKIESASMNVQTKILRIIEEKSIQRLGSSEAISLETRIIASSNTDLQALVEQGKFRKDLYYRLSAVELRVPPLREHQEDIPLLFYHFVQQSAKRLGREKPDISNDVLANLMKQKWPGNVRELRNTADRYVMGFSFIEHDRPVGKNQTLSDQLSEAEKAIIMQTLTKYSGNLRDTYTQLGVSRKTLYEKMHRYGLDKNDFRLLLE